MSQHWAPPSGADHRAHGSDHSSEHPGPYRWPFDDEADEIAPVDRQADPAHWLPGRALVVAAVIIGVALLATVVICLIVWLTPPMHHLQVPVIPKG